MEYPAYRDSMNLYLDGKLCIENMACPKEALLLDARDNTPMWHSFENFEETLAFFLGGDTYKKYWKETDFDQRGMRATWEFQYILCENVIHTAVFFYRSEKGCDLTNIAPERPENLICTYWENRLPVSTAPIGGMPPISKEGPFYDPDIGLNFRSGENVSFLGNDGKTRRTGTIHRIFRRQGDPDAPLMAEILQSERDSNGHRQRGLFVRVSALEK